MITRFKKLVKSFPSDTHLRIAFADISFSFPAKCNYPNLSVRIDGYGLINPLEGRTVATLPEIWLAVYLKAKIIYHEAVIIDDYELPADVVENREELSYVIRPLLKELFDLRSEAKANGKELLQQLYKTYTNSIYGKFAQGIVAKNTFNTKEGGTKKLPKSSVTNAYYASMTTGLIRAALSELLVAIDELIQEGHNYKIISATTDGLLYGIDESKVSVEDTLEIQHKSYNYDSIVSALEDGYKRFKPFEIVDPVLAVKIEKFPSLQLLKLSHEAWNDLEYIEVKHVANKIHNFKTRGQVGLYESNDKSVCTILAKAGHKIGGTKDEQATWMVKHYDEDKDIQKYSFSILASVRNIIDEDNPIKDMVSIPQERIISLDYDNKRAPVNATDTAPHKNINEFMKYRQSGEYLKRLRKRPTVDAVNYKYLRAKQNVRKIRTDKAFCVRHMLRGITQSIKPFKNLNMTYMALVQTLQPFGVSLSAVKHAKSARFTPNMIADTTGNRVIIRTVLKALNYPKDKTNYSNFLELLLYKKISNPEDVSYLD